MSATDIAVAGQLAETVDHAPAIAAIMAWQWRYSKVGRLSLFFFGTQNTGCYLFRFPSFSHEAQ